MSQKQQQSAESTLALANMVGSIGCVTSLASFVIIGAAFGLGYWLDNLLGTKPFILFAALLGSFPVTLYVIVRISLSAMERAQRAQERAKLAREKQALQDELKKDEDSY